MQQLVWRSRWSLFQWVMPLTNEYSALWITEEFEPVSIYPNEAWSCYEVFAFLPASVQLFVLIGGFKIFLTHSKQPSWHQSARCFTRSLQEASHQTGGISFFSFFLHTGHRPASLACLKQPSQLEQARLLGETVLSLHDIVRHHSTSALNLG